MKNQGRQGIFHTNETTVFCSIEGGMWHLSISHPNRNPMYDEIKEARYKYMPDNINVAVLFPPIDEFVNLHSFCFHLWQINDRELLTPSN